MTQKPRRGQGPFRAVVQLIIISFQNLFSLISYQAAVIWWIQISTIDQSDLPQHFTNDICIINIIIIIIIILNLLLPISYQVMAFW
jgi:hypothetical protein